MNNTLLNSRWKRLRYSSNSLKDDYKWFAEKEAQSEWRRKPDSIVFFFFVLFFWLQNECSSSANICYIIVSLLFPSLKLKQQLLLLFMSAHAWGGKKENKRQKDEPRVRFELQLAQIGHKFPGVHSILIGLFVYLLMVDLLSDGYLKITQWLSIHLHPACKRSIAIAIQLGIYKQSLRPCLRYVYLRSWYHDISLWYIVQPYLWVKSDFSTFLLSGEEELVVARSWGWQRSGDVKRGDGPRR